jgi:hypothetical protein
MNRRLEAKIEREGGTPAQFGVPPRADYRGAIVAFAVRRSRRFVSGLFAGLLGYAIILAPALIISAPSDVSTGESISIAAFAAILLAPAVLLGAVVGALVAERRVSRRRIV